MEGGGGGGSRTHAQPARGTQEGTQILDGLVPPKLKGLFYTKCQPCFMHSPPWQAQPGGCEEKPVDPNGATAPTAHTGTAAGAELEAETGCRLLALLPGTPPWRVTPCFPQAVLPGSRWPRQELELGHAFSSSRSCWAAESQEPLLNPLQNLNKTTQYS